MTFWHPLRILGDRAKAGALCCDMASMIVSEADAVAVSLIENQQREPMHPADACEAFRRHCQVTESEVPRRQV